VFSIFKETSKSGNVRTPRRKRELKAQGGFEASWWKKKKNKNRKNRKSPKTTQKREKKRSAPEENGQVKKTRELRKKDLTAPRRPSLGQKRHNDAVRKRRQGSKARDWVGNTNVCLDSLRGKKERTAFETITKKKGKGQIRAIDQKKNNHEKPEGGKNTRKKKW